MLIALIQTIPDNSESTSYISSVWLPAEGTQKSSILAKIQYTNKSIEQETIPNRRHIEKREGDFTSTLAGSPGLDESGAETGPNGSIAAASSLQPAIASMEPAINSNRANYNKSSLRRSDQFNGDTATRSMFNSDHFNSNKSANDSLNEQVQFDEEHFINLANILNNANNAKHRRTVSRLDNHRTDMNTVNEEHPKDNNNHHYHHDGPGYITSKVTNSSQYSNNFIPGPQVDRTEDLSSNFQDVDQETDQPLNHWPGSSNDFHGRRRTTIPPGNFTKTYWTAMNNSDDISRNSDSTEDPTTTTTRAPLIYYHMDGDKWNQVTPTSTANSALPEQNNSVNSNSLGSQQLNEHYELGPFQQGPRLVSHLSRRRHKQNYERAKLMEATIARQRLLARQASAYHGGNNVASLGNNIQAIPMTSQYQGQSHIRYPFVTIPNALSSHSGNTLTPELGLYTSKRYDSHFGDANSYEADIRNRVSQQQRQLMAQRFLNMHQRKQQTRKTNTRDVNKQTGNKRSLLGVLGQRLNPWASDGSNSDNTNDNNQDNPLISLEHYFFNDKAGYPKSSKRKNLINLQSKPQITAIYPIALPSYPTNPTLTGYTQVVQPTVPRAPDRLPLRANHIASSSLSQATLADPISVDPHLNSITPTRHGSPSTKNVADAASFIPVVAVSVTKTSPAPKAEEQMSSVDDEPTTSPSTNSDLDDYLDRKLGGHRAERYHYNRNYSPRYHFGSDDYGGSTSGSQMQQSINGHMRSNANDRSTTTVKSAVFGYLPHQLAQQQANPLIQALTQAYQPLASSQPSEYLYQPDNEHQHHQASTSTNGLHPNSISQDDILHPFNNERYNSANYFGSMNFGFDPYAASARYRTSQQSPYNLMASMNPLLTATDHSALRANHHGQMLAVAGSEYSPFFGNFMLAPTVPIEQNEDQRSSSDQSSASSESSSSISSSNSSPSNSKGKKRSSDFFANAGQLLLSALPLLLAPTLGLMFASSSTIPTIARHQNPLAPSSSSPSIQPAIPSNYINSLSTNLMSSTPHYLSTVAPFYASSSTSQLNAQGMRGPGRPTKLATSKNVNSTGGASGDRVKKPAAIVVTTSTTAHPFLDAQNDTLYDLANGSTRTQTITAVDSLNVSSNQTLVLIPSDSHHRFDIPIDQASSINETSGSDTNKLNEFYDFTSHSSQPQSVHTQDGVSVAEQTHQPSKDEFLMPRKNLSTITSHPEGADFDTQYASLDNGTINSNGTPNQSISANSDIGPSYAMNITTNSVNKLNRNNVDRNRIKYDEQIDDDDVSNKLYPVSTWPPFRRKTVSLVTSQGNKSYVDSSDKYQAMNEFNLSNSNGESIQMTVNDKASPRETELVYSPQQSKRANHRIFRPILRRNKRDIDNDTSDIMLSGEARQGGKSHLITTTLVTQIDDDGSEPKSHEYDPVVESNMLRDDLLSKKIKLDRLSSKQFRDSGDGFHYTDNSGLLDSERPLRLSGGMRGKIAIPVMSRMSRDDSDPGYVMAKEQHNRVSEAINDPIESSSTDQSITVSDADFESVRGRDPYNHLNRRRSADLSRQMRPSPIVMNSREQFGFPDVSNRTNWSESHLLSDSSARSNMQPTLRSRERVTSAMNNTREPQYSKIITNGHIENARKRPSLNMDSRPGSPKTRYNSSVSGQSELIEASDRDSLAYPNSYHSRHDPYIYNRHQMNHHYADRNYQFPGPHYDHTYEMNNFSVPHYRNEHPAYNNAHGYRVPSGISPADEYASNYDRYNYSYRDPMRQNQYRPPFQQPLTGHYPSPSSRHDYAHSHHPLYGASSRYGPERYPHSMDNFGHSASASTFEQPMGLMQEAGPLASLASNNSHDSGTVNEYLKQVHFSDSDRDKLMAR